jgi:hypothetical protein
MVRFVEVERNSQVNAIARRQTMRGPTILIEFRRRPIDSTQQKKFVDRRPATRSLENDGQPVFDAAPA